MSMTSQQLRFKFIQHAKSAFISFESCRIKIMLAVLSLLLCLGDTYSGSSVPCGNCTDLDSAALLQSHRAALRKENALLQTDGQEVHEDITNVAPHNLGRYDYFEACSKSTPLSTLEHNFSIKVKMPHVCPDGTRLQKETAAGIVVTGCCSIASTWCGGCEEQDGAKESCKSCQGGYVLEGGHCIRHGQGQLLIHDIWLLGFFAAQVHNGKSVFSPRVLPLVAGARMARRLRTASKQTVHRTAPGTRPGRWCRRFSR